MDNEKNQDEADGQTSSANLSVTAGDDVSVDFCCNIPRKFTAVLLFGESEQADIGGVK